MHPLDKAERILRGDWPRDPKWIYESPDKGRTVYRRLSEWGFKQLVSNDEGPVADIETLNEEYYTLIFERKT